MHSSRLLAFSSIALLSTFASLPALADPLQNFAAATCVYKKQLGNPPAAMAAAMMLRGMAGMDPQALNAWRANTGGNTYWGNIQAGRNVSEFSDWMQSVPDSKVNNLLISAIQRRCP